jgi:hypothetical protein
VSGKVVTPALGENSFTCPHCGANSHQTWYKAYIDGYEKGSGPMMPDEDSVDLLRANREIEKDLRDSMIEWVNRKLGRGLFFEGSREIGVLLHTEIGNLSISGCYSCGELALWVADRLIHPSKPSEIEPNPEMPDHIKHDFVEAATIVDSSPRGAAALLRLSVQKLMVHLELPGKDLYADIGELVKRGLDGRIQKALDVVRVIGNNAVHPGQIDLRDDRATATQLFGLVNLIVEAMIATPKHIENMFAGLPAGVLKAIEKRDDPKKD